MKLEPSSQSFAFERPWVLLALLALPLLGVLAARRGRVAALTFSSLHLLQRLGRQGLVRSGGFRPPWLMMAVLGTGVVALANPQWVRQFKVVKDSGIEMIVAIDVSRSMLVQDMVLTGTKVDRLTAARSVIRDFVRRRPMDRIGLIAFAGRPYLASPMTLDHSWLEQSLSRVRVGLVEDGTAIGSAIAAAARRLDRREAKSKVIVLLTDGANNSGNLAPVTAAELANTLGVKIHAIAVGTPGRHTIPTPNGRQILDQEFDLETLEAVAAASGGQAFKAEDTANLEQIFAYIDSLEMTERKAKVRVDPTDFFPHLVFAMTALAMVRLLAQETVLRRYP